MASGPKTPLQPYVGRFVQVLCTFVELFEIHTRFHCFARPRHFAEVYLAQKNLLGLLVIAYAWSQLSFLNSCTICWWNVGMVILGAGLCSALVSFQLEYAYPNFIHIHPFYSYLHCCVCMAVLLPRQFPIWG